MAKTVFIKVPFHDAGDFPNERRYRLRQTMADDGSNMAAVLTAIADAVTALDVLTWDHIGDVTTEIVLPQAGAAANVAANNSVEAFSRTTIPSLGDKRSHFSVPAWDDDVFDKAPNGLLSAAYDVAAATFNALICDPDTGANMDYVFSQNRGMKRGQRLVRG